MHQRLWKRYEQPQTAALTSPHNTKQPPAKAGGFMLRIESPDTRRLNDAS